MRFDTNSFVIGIDTFASITLGNHSDQFEDLKMHNNTEVEGIKGGLYITGTGTFKFHIEDDKGGLHLIKIPNSKYVPDFKEYASCCPIIGRRRQRTINLSPRESRWIPTTRH
jgi:hypothetical protein